MKQQQKLSAKNKIIVFTILFGLMLCSVNINAQSINKKIDFNDEKIADYIVKYFIVKEVNNTLYFKFLVLENRINTAYVLEASTNGVNYHSVKLKEGFKSPNDTPLLYCYSVDLNNLNANMYRIKRISPDGDKYSSIIQLNNHVNPGLSAQNN